jgi:flagellar hook assembly protein FlgD
MFQLPVAAAVTIDIFTVGGRRIRRLDDYIGTAGANEVYWNGLDAEGDELANGVYLYRIYAVSDEYHGDKAEVIGRAVIMR